MIYCLLFRNISKGLHKLAYWLIPRKEVTVKWKVFMPILLCNVSSKIIYKILTNRLNKILPYIISSWQTKCTSGRGIMDNVLLAQELLYDIDEKLVNQNMILKLEMEKTYDRVDWSFFIFR